MITYQYRHCDFLICLGLEGNSTWGDTKTFTKGNDFVMWPRCGDIIITGVQISVRGSGSLLLKTNIFVKYFCTHFWKPSSHFARFGVKLTCPSNFLVPNLHHLHDNPFRTEDNQVAIITNVWIHEELRLIQTFFHSQSNPHFLLPYKKGIINKYVPVKWRVFECLYSQ